MSLLLTLDSFFHLKSGFAGLQGAAQQLRTGCGSYVVEIALHLKDLFPLLLCCMLLVWPFETYFLVCEMVKIPTPQCCYDFNEIIVRMFCKL